eukprot:gene31408-6574_t
MGAVDGKKYLVTAAIGAAGATALYLYGRKSIESLISRSTGLSLNSEAKKVDVDADEDLNSEIKKVDVDAEEERLDLESSMENHFGFIQSMSAPQEELARLLPKLRAALYESMSAPQEELARLLPKLRAALYEVDTHQQMTDLQQLRSTERLGSLARQCFSRTLATCWLLPLLELHIRVKLNIIGRHLYLQEKLTALSVPLSSGGHAQGIELPAQLSPEVIESFMGCDSFVEDGSKPGESPEVIESFMGCDSFVEDGSKPGESPEVIESFMGCDTFVEDGSKPGESPEVIESFMGCDTFVEDGSKWVLEGMDAVLDSISLEEATPTELLETVLEGVDAVLDSISLEEEVTPTELLETIATMIAEVDKAMRASCESPWAELLCSPHNESDMATKSGMATKVQQAAVGGAESYRRAMGWQAAVQELQEEMRQILSSPEFSAALRNSIEVTFRAAATHVLAAIPPLPTPPAKHQTQSPNPELSEPSSVNPSQEEDTSAISTDQQGGSSGEDADSASSSATRDPESGASTASEATSEPQASSPAVEHELSSGKVDAGEASQPKLKPVLSASVPSRPMARLLKPVQSASDPLFSTASTITREITTLASADYDAGLCLGEAGEASWPMARLPKLVQSASTPSWPVARFLKLVQSASVTSWPMARLLKPVQSASVTSWPMARLLKPVQSASNPLFQYGLPHH